MNKKGIFRWINFIVGILMSALAFNIFLLPANITVYGISGLSISFNYLFGIDATLLIAISTTILILISYLLLGKKSTRKTIIGSILYIVFVTLTLPISRYIDLGKIDLLVITIFGAVFSGIGKGLVYKEGFNTCESDVMCGLIVKYFKVPMGTAILLIDGFVVLIGGITFGAERMVYSLIALFIISKLSNKIMFGLNNSKTFYVISKKSDEIKKYIYETLKQDVTVFEATGKSSHKKNIVLMTATSNDDYRRLKRMIASIDPNAFVTILNSYEKFNENRSITKISN